MFGYATLMDFHSAFACSWRQLSCNGTGWHILSWPSFASLGLVLYIMFWTVGFYMNMLPWRHVHCFGVFCSCLGGAHLASLSAYFVSLSAYDVRLFVHFAGLLYLPVCIWRFILAFGLLCLSVIISACFSWSRTMVLAGHAHGPLLLSLGSGKSCEMLSVQWKR